LLELNLHYLNLHYLNVDNLNKIDYKIDYIQKPLTSLNKNGKTTLFPNAFKKTTNEERTITETRIN